jgi:predicted O-methyltransferase YrrM
MTTMSSAVDRVARARDALFAGVRESATVDLSFLGQPLVEDGWAGAPDLLRVLYSLVAALRPRHVIEFGSGVSTTVLARAARTCGGCMVTSVDHDPRFTESTAGLLGDDGSVVSLQCAPLVARVWGGRLGPCYLIDESLLASARPADLVLVDGPPQILGGRSTMLPQALGYAQSGSIILFDDADREGERDALTSWESILGDSIELHRLAGFARGLVAVILAAPTTARIRMSPRNS